MKKKSIPEFTVDDIKSMRHDSARKMGLDFTEDKVREILTANPDGYADAIWDDFEQVGHPEGGSMDTAVRDLWFSAIAYYYTGRDWPLNGDSDEVSKKFFSKLKKALKKDKIKITN